MNATAACGEVGLRRNPGERASSASPSQVGKSPLGGEPYQRSSRNLPRPTIAKDVAAMAAFFSENGVRITPSGIFRGRDAIRREMQRVIDLGLHDYSVQRTVSRALGDMVFNAGEWRASWVTSSFTATIRRYWCVRATTSGYSKRP